MFSDALLVHPKTIRLIWNNMEQILKYVWVVKTLYKAGHQGISLADLNEKWLDTEYSRNQPIPRQTFNRWKNELVELFGVLIECKRVGGHRYYIANPDVLAEEGLSSWLLDTYTTVGTLSNRMGLKDRILVEEIPSSHDFLEDIIEAMQHNNVLHITYQGFDKDKSDSFDIEPYCVKLFQRRWYLLARSPYYNKILLYGVDRIMELTATDKLFKLPDDFDAHQYFSTFFGIVLDESVPVQRIVLRANCYHKHYMRTLPLHQSQRELCDDGDTADFELRLRPTYDFCMELLRIGNMVEVIEPKSMRKVMHDWVKNMWNLYKDEK